MTCPHQSQPPGKDTGRRLCAIALRGGHPYVGECNQCIAAGQNNEAFRDMLLAGLEKTHPKKRNPISGCCDSAKNY